MNHLKIYTDHPETIPKKFISALSESGMEIPNDFDPFEILIDWNIRYSTIQILQDGKIIEEFETI